MQNSELDKQSNKPNINATKLEVSSFGVIGGLISIEHGIFETAQGNVPTNGIIINAIAPGHWYWKEGGELAMTIIPNFLITGIVAIIIGIMVIIWSIRFVSAKYGALGLFTLTILTLLFGGGIAFLIIGIIISIIATQINKSHTWWDKHLSNNVKKYFTKLWLSLFSISIIVLGCLVLGGIFGVWFLKPNNAIILLSNVGLISIGLIIFTIIFGLIHDIEV
ncbi:MAG: hypothetical protein ACFFB0_16105 [Promethearchaeota archaeon]